MAIQIYKLTELQHLQLLPKKESNFSREISGKWKRTLEVLSTRKRTRFLEQGRYHQSGTRYGEFKNSCHVMKQAKLMFYELKSTFL